MFVSQFSHMLWHASYCTLNVYFFTCQICCCFDTQSIRNQLLIVNDTKCTVLQCTVIVPVRTGYIALICDLYDNSGGEVKARHRIEQVHRVQEPPPPDVNTRNLVNFIRNRMIKCCFCLPCYSTSGQTTKALTFSF